MENVAAARPPSPHGDVGSGRKLHAGEPGLAEAGVAFGQCLLVYYGIAILLNYVVPAVVATRNVQRAKQRHPDTMRDASRSLIPLLIKSYTLFAAEWLHYKGYGVMDNRGLAEVAKSPSGLLQVLAMVALLDLFHDAWFFFTHRLLHSRWMLRNVHYMHHQSTNPSAFTGYSFHWIEAVMVFSVAVAEIFIFPIPLGLHRVYELWMIMIHIGGHCGFEIAPFVPQIAHLLELAGLMVGVTSGAVNNVKHHDMHHQHPKYHFSLYFTHWDYLLGSMHPEYVRTHPCWWSSSTPTSSDGQGGLRSVNRK